MLPVGEREREKRMDRGPFKISRVEEVNTFHFFFQSPQPRRAIDIVMLYKSAKPVWGFDCFSLDLYFLSKELVRTAEEGKGRAKTKKGILRVLKIFPSS